MGNGLRFTEVLGGKVDPNFGEVLKSIRGDGKEKLVSMGILSDSDLEVINKLKNNKSVFELVENCLNQGMSPQQLKGICENNLHDSELLLPAEFDVKDLVERIRTRLSNFIIERDKKCFRSSN